MTTQTRQSLRQRLTCNLLYCHQCSFTGGRRNSWLTFTTVFLKNFGCQLLRRLPALVHQEPGRRPLQSKCRILARALGNPPRHKVQTIQPPPLMGSDRHKVTYGVALVIPGIEQVSHQQFSDDNMAQLFQDDLGCTNMIYSQFYFRTYLTSNPCCTSLSALSQQSLSSQRQQS